MKILFKVGDITKMDVDAVVNAANNSLLTGAGVNGAIHSAAGYELDQECRRLGPCKTGDAKITGGYGLPAKYIIHTPGPRWVDGQHGEAEQLASSYRRSMQLAHEYGVKTIAFPSISTGIYGYPMREAAIIALRTILSCLAQYSDMHVTFVLRPKTLVTYRKVLNTLM